MEQNPAEREGQHEGGAHDRHASPVAVGPRGVLALPAGRRAASVCGHHRLAQVRGLHTRRTQPSDDQTI